jgi:hypothetical protein
MLKFRHPNDDVPTTAMVAGLGMEPRRPFPVSEF